MTATEQRLLEIIQTECRRSGYAKSLVFVGVLMAGMDYHNAFRVLTHLEEQQAVTVTRQGKGLPIIMVAK
jgi:hypothetical protein